MPELPEVETIRRQLNKHILEKTIVGIKVISKKSFIGDSSRLINKKVIKILRFGKYFCFQLTKNLFLNFHLKMTGQLLYARDMNKAQFNTKIPFTKTDTMPGKTTRVIINFNDNSGLFFNDLRKFGWAKVGNKPEQPKGVDVLSKEFTIHYFIKIVRTSKKRIKILLIDQDKLSGIGNIYANEILFNARINPLRVSLFLKPLEISKLFQAIKKIIEQGIRFGGSSSADEAFIQTDGSKGRFQQRLYVYQREDKSCHVCKTLIKRIKHGGRSSFYCPNCQPIIHI